MINKKSLLCFFTIAAFLFGSLPGNSQSENWTHFRGSNMNGIAVTSKVPLIWGDSDMKWKTEIHDKGWSSPVIYNNQIWVTTAKDDGKELYAVCVDFRTGKIIYDISVFTPDSVFKKHETNSYATPTPCIEKGFVYVHYGSLGTACIRTTNGSIVWKRNDLKCDYMMGPASCPVIYKNLVILHFEGTDAAYIVALDKSNGKLVWRTDRPKEIYAPRPNIGKKAFTTPIIINVKGHDLLISNGSFVTVAYDPATGQEVWRVVRGAESTVAMPFTDKGVVFWFTGFMVADDKSTFCEILAVNPDGKGDITASNILWRKKAEQLQLLTPVIKDGLIYTVDAKNNMMCIDAVTGEEIWSTHVKANFNASPVSLNGNIWFFSVKGEVLVIKAGRKYEVVAQNKMDSGIWATPAFLRNSVIMRTEKYLCRIGQ
jgi:outer membrane protein assembly factor BamB